MATSKLQALWNHPAGPKTKPLKNVTHGRAPGNSVPPLLLDVPSSLPTLNIPTLDVTNPIFPRRMQIHSLNDSSYSDPISDGPHYFVTEPNDSPKHPSGPPLSPKVSGLTHTPWPTLSNIPLSPKASPTHSHEDISLSNVFGRILSLKRKSVADPNSTTKSKALKLNNHSHLTIIPLSQPLLVATIPSHPLVSNPIPDPTHKLPPKRITPRKRISKPKPSLSHEYLEGGSNLVEIQVALDDKIGVGIDYDMDQRSAEDGLSGGLALWWNSDISLSVDHASNNVVHTTCVSLFNSKKWATSFVYGSPTVDLKEEVWDYLRDIAFINSGPWFCIGDFNDIAEAKDKFGGRIPSTARISAFNDFLNDCGLLDLGFKGQCFTWWNKRVGAEAVMERLDKAYANIEGREAFPQAMVFHDSAIGSDHCPILLSLEEPLKIHRPFRFESMWTAEEECEGIIKEQWRNARNTDSRVRVTQSLTRCKGSLQTWHRSKFTNLKEQMSTLKSQIQRIQEAPYSQASKVEEEQLVTKLNKLWEQDEMYWHQRSRLNYLKFGDSHSRFFHITATQRRQRNLILRLKNDKDEWVTSQKGCDDAVVWGQSSSGNYTVKPGYQLAFKRAYATEVLQGSSSTELSTAIWKVIWRLKSPPRTKHFLWRAIRNAIATKENLFTRKCARSPLCSLCRIEIESIEHVLLRCEWTRGVWENSGLSFSSPIQNVVSLKSWMEGLAEEFGNKFSDILGTISQIFWAIWKQRNEWIFSQQKPNAVRTIKQEFQVHGDFLAAACSQENRLARNHGDSNASKWQRPLHDRWKFNCDGAFNPSDKSAAFAVLVRDNNGSVVEVNYGRIKVYSALAAEAWAIRVAVSMAKAWGKRDAIIESDCQVLVRMLSPETS
ncbi:hypothetical protein RHGRI_037157 [Rhododendron griersonianum]|uniref:Uncharacterized protein n=1 Tax=Rhododendron griersonianum TaxID=479676 RepID=A0AAV6HUQ2_9ERIC|nr:hypothetical protein RHGRI_037157 [Rhododendron griersonianum]